MNNSFHKIISLTDLEKIYDVVNQFGNLIMIYVNIPVRRSRSSGELRATLPELQSHLSGVENQSGITFSD